ncbi:MAG: hypothetical protein Q7R49_06460 [Candidatus Daviesbacteria bacterium]|nr:hypothetical protein [Candidatus Daviesbacteria bacterium]
MFPAFIKNPQNCHYQGQDDDENILLLLRAHPITNLPWIILAILIFLTPFLVPNLIPFLGLDFSFLPSHFPVVMLIINYLLVLIIVFEGFLGWYFNVNLLTDKKMVDIDFHSVLSKSIDVALLRDVQESTSHLAGIVGMIFNFGDVFIKTAASTESIDLKDIPHPDIVSDIIMDTALKHRGG